MSFNDNSPRVVWHRAFQCSVWALVVGILLGCMLPTIAEMAFYKPLAALLVLLALAGLPLILNGIGRLSLIGIRRRTIGKWLKDPVSWTGVVGVALYLAMVPVGTWIVSNSPLFCEFTGALNFGSGNESFFLGVYGDGRELSHGYLAYRGRDLGHLEINFRTNKAFLPVSGRRPEPTSLNQGLRDFVGGSGLPTEAARKSLSAIVDAIAEAQTEPGFREVVDLGRIRYRPSDSAVLWISTLIWYPGVFVFFYVTISWSNRARRTGC